MSIEKKYSEIYENKIDQVSLSLATPQDVLDWSNGEVTKPETVNYKTHKPESDGLFDELIFGPVTDYKCPICGKKYKRSSEGILCEATQVCAEKKPEILPKISRRSRMGHISLNSPVVHFWFFKVDNSIIAKLLDLKVDNSEKSHSKSLIEGIVYYKSHLVIESGGIKALPVNTVIEINDAATIYRNALLEIRDKHEPGTFAHTEMTTAIENLEDKAKSKMGKDYGIDFYELNDIIQAYSDAKIDTGAKVIKTLLENFDLKQTKEDVRSEIKKLNEQIKNSVKVQTSKIAKRDKLYKRLKIINSFIVSGQEPKNMLIYNLPVIPADLRPLVQLDGGRHSTSDINELYRRIIIRNNRLKKWEATDAPILIVQNELRMIQEAVDALIDNARRSANQVVSKDNRPLKSIADALTGKKGRFRQNLLGKRVDYSGRSVIVGGPNLKLHQCGIPREMATKLFEPWIVRELILKNETQSIKGAKKMIDDFDARIWPYVAKVIEGKPVLLNRAPTLHRLSIQAFEPVLIRGKAIRLHPLVTTAFNADFDGDQMAVHVPISPLAQLEAKELMYANKNILGPKDGEPIINPSQDIILGIYYLTTEVANAKGEAKFFADYESLMIAYQNKVVDLGARVILPYKNIKPELALKQNLENAYIISSVGKFIFNNIFPTSFQFINEESDIENFENSVFIVKPGENLKEKISSLPIRPAFDKRNVAQIIRKFFDIFTADTSQREIAELIKKVNSSFVNSNDLLLNEISKLKSLSNYDGQDLTINEIHSTTIFNIIKETYSEILKDIKLSNEGVEREFEVSEKIKLLDNVWFAYTNQIASVLDKIKELGFEFSTKSGITMSYSDIISADNRESQLKEGNEFVDTLWDKFKYGLITDDERYRLVVEKWSEIKNNIQDNLDVKVKNNPNNPIHIMMSSGARAKISNLVQLAGIRGLMANNTKQLKADAENELQVRNTVEIPVKSSFLDGLTSFEFYSSTHGARKGLTDTALNTAKSGYLTRRLVDIGQTIVVKEDDCGSDYGFDAKSIIDTRTRSVIVPLSERIEGRFANVDILDSNSNILVKRNQMITSEIASRIIDNGHTVVSIRSVLGCNSRNGVCKKCYGKDLATNRIVNIGEAVGIIAAQSIGEPGTQLTMRTFHTGGVAGVEDITGGFSRLIELIDAYEKPWGRPAVISKKQGKVKSILPHSENANLEIVTITHTNDLNNAVDIEYEIFANAKKRVSVGDEVIAGQKITEGPIIIRDLLKLTNERVVQNYLLKEIQRIYRMQGISISDKYIEIIIRQMLSKIVITDPGDSELYLGSKVDILEYQKEASKLLSKGKRPPYGNVVINGAKITPLLSESFLAAASYQETAKILVYAAISSKVDKLEGLKENIILGHKIPAGTSSHYEVNSKYDIQTLDSYFEDNK